MTTTLVTGANKGLGYEAARRLIEAGHVNVSSGLGSLTRAFDASTDEGRSSRWRTARPSRR